MAAPEAWMYRVAQNLSNSWLHRRIAERKATARLEARPPSPAAGDDADAISVRGAIGGLPDRQVL